MAKAKSTRTVTRSRTKKNGKSKGVAKRKGH